MGPVDGRIQAKARKICLQGQDGKAAVCPGGEDGSLEEFMDFTVEGNQGAVPPGDGKMYGPVRLSRRKDIQGPQGVREAAGIRYAEFVAAGGKPAVVKNQNRLFAGTAGKAARGEDVPFRFGGRCSGGTRRDQAEFRRLRQITAPDAEGQDRPSVRKGKIIQGDPIRRKTFQPGLKGGEYLDVYPFGVSRGSFYKIVGLDPVPVGAGGKGKFDKIITGKLIKDQGPFSGVFLLLHLHPVAGRVFLRFPGETLYETRFPVAFLPVVPGLPFPVLTRRRRRQGEQDGVQQDAEDRKELPSGNAAGHGSLP